MQAHGAEMMRVAACLLTEAGVRVCLPVHDAFLIEAPEPEIDEAVLLAQQLMSDASARVLAGFRLRTAATIYRHPDRYADARGVAMWSTVTQRLDLGRTRVPCAQSAT